MALPKKTQQNNTNIWHENLVYSHKSVCDIGTILDCVEKDAHVVPAVLKIKRLNLKYSGTSNFEHNPFQETVRLSS
jgi:hypothetical protein